jgi:hypothetical protein
MFGMGAMNLEAILKATGMIEPDLPSGALSSKQFNTIVELLGEGELEGSATASKAGITDKTSTAYFNALKMWRLILDLVLLVKHLSREYQILKLK